jgi:hypothetical protein
VRCFRVGDDASSSSVSERTITSALLAILTVILQKGVQSREVREHPRGQPHPANGNALSPKKSGPEEAGEGRTKAGLPNQPVA